MKLPIPEKTLAQHVIVLGKTRSGKSSKARVIVEHLLENREPVCVIDPKGDWWGLKLAANGKGPGYGVVIFGGDHADVPINEHSGAAVAELVATGNRPAIIDLKGWMTAPRTRFFIDFASTLFKLTRGHRYLVIDECHNFVPKGRLFEPDAAKALHWGNRLASEGGGLGLILVAASQRPQKVHNDFLTSCETLIACRVIHKADRDAYKDWIDGCGDPEIGKDMLGQLAQLSRTEAYVWSPEVEFGPKRMTWPFFETYDSFKPQTVEASKTLKGWASVDLDEVKTKLAKVVEEAKANDPRVLRAEIARLTKENDALTKAKGVVVQMDRSEIDAAEKRGYVGARKLSLAFLQTLLNSCDQIFDAVGPARKLITDTLLTIEKEIEPVATALRKVDVKTFEKHVAPELAARRRAPPARPDGVHMNGGDETLSRPQLRALQGLRWWQQMGHDVVSKTQLAAICKWQTTGSNIRDRLSSLRTLGLVDYPREGEVQLTPAGRAIAPAPDMRESLVENLRAILTSPQLRVFDELVACGGNATKDGLATRLGWEPDGSNIRDRCSSLKTLEIIEYPRPGEVALQEWVK